ncbi:FliI/YscN family ATPase [Ketobacter alkanivorans]|uniref:protein-secreting ATPase n=1 Tax=Ketobacter alkanivorans TaxID=1917421 RepID=A0A2K9LKS1_9GAMM|nr:FliI/YscN family ATPase [Ketobacter alkanivorans]AUM12959.1 flagellum-specific ATP synthase FliI [Ketobacter alkanivorans]
MQSTDLAELIKSCDTIRRTGRVLQFYGLALESVGPDVFVGEICEISTPGNLHPVKAEVVGFRNGNVVLIPFGNLHGIHVGSEVVATGKSATIPVGEELLGRVIDGFGFPIDEKGPIRFSDEIGIYRNPINPMMREPVDVQLETGIKVIDAFTPVGKGQRIGIFAGSGVGKSTLLSMITKSSSADVNVIALIGERGREVQDFISKGLGREGLSNTVVVVAGADQPALVRLYAAYAATAISEYFMKQGKDVVLAMDSITRFAMAQREIGLAIGEPPTARGYTPSAFDKIPKLVERAGNFAGQGSITAFYTVLVEGDDFNEPVSDNVRAILDGHIVLDRKIAEQNVYPAINVLNSVSRLVGDLLSPEERMLIGNARKLLSRYESSKDMIDFGGYIKGENRKLDECVEFESSFLDVRVQEKSYGAARKDIFNWLVRALPNV